MRPVSRLSLLTLALSMLALLHAGFAWGNTLYVKKSGSDWGTLCSASDPCQTLARAIDTAVSGDTIKVGPGTYAEGSGLSIDNKSLTIDGGWWLRTTVTLGPIDPTRVFRPVITIGPDATVTLTGMTISGGTYGGIDNQGNLTLRSVWIAGNTGGGGIGNSDTGYLALTNVAIDRNAGGAGLMNDGTALVVDSRIDRTYHQGALQGYGVLNSGLLTIDRGEIAGNEATGLHNQGTVNLTNVTISGNGRGGVSTIGPATLRHVTISANAANTQFTSAGGLQIGPTTPVLENSIVADNAGNECGFGPGVLKSIIVSYSLIGDGSCTDAAFPNPASGNLIGVDPKLGPLAYQTDPDLGMWLFLIGATHAMRPLRGSPAIDSAGDAYCSPYDQLGQPRGGDGNGDGTTGCDMGAYEVQPGSVDERPRYLSAAAAPAAAACGPATVGGATVVTYCGPAKVTLTFGGKTYRITGGTCSYSMHVWTLLVGSQTMPPAKPKSTGFQAAYLGKPPKAGTYTKLGFSLSFEIPGWRWSIVPGLPHKIVVTEGGKRGTFTASFYTGTKNGTSKGSGSWTC